jgi:hypothetical protein
LAAAGELAAAKHAYLESASSAESCTKQAQAACLVVYIQSNRRLAQNAVALGNREEAMEFAGRALRAGGGSLADTIPNLALPRALAALGFTYAALERSSLRASGDHQEAQLWLEKSLAAWHAAQSGSGFSTDDLREMKEVEEMLSRTDH